MSTQLLSNLQAFKQAIVQNCGRGFAESYGESAVLIVQVRDPIHCRIFELDVFYEFSDYKVIDLDNIDMTISFRAVTPEGAHVGTLAEFRIASYPETPGVFCILSCQGSVELFAVAIPLLEEFIRSISGIVILIAGIQNKKNLDTWKAGGFTSTFEVPNTKSHFLHKII